MRVIVTPKALKQLDNLPKLEQLKIKKKLIALELDPLLGKKLSGELSELRSLRTWPYRILYYIDQKGKKLYIASIVHRQEVYR